MNSAYQFTREDFLRETTNFRTLMGDKAFWAKSQVDRDRAVTGYGFVYINADLAEDDINTFHLMMDQYLRRETMYLRTIPE